MGFKVGDRVVYPSQGVGRIRDLVKRKIGGVRSEFYVLEMEMSNSTVLIPRDKVHQVGLRRLSDKAVVQELLDVLKNHPGDADPDWKARYKKNLQSMQSGDLAGVGQVFIDLHRLSEKKSLGHREQKMMDQARQFLLSEIAAVEKIGEEEASEMLAGLLESSVE
jgi:CarD family transcriptional regulator